MRAVAPSDARVCGHVEVFMQGAKQLRSVQLVGKQDPFAQLAMEIPGIEAGRLGDSAWVGTSVFEDGGDVAEWEQSLVVSVDDVASGVLHLRVRDESAMTNLIGSVRIPLCGLQSAGTGTGGGSDKRVPADVMTTGQVWYQLYVRCREGQVLWRQCCGQ